MDSHSITKFLGELASTTALVFCSFFLAYVSAVLFVYGSKHSATSDWEQLRKRMSLLLPREQVRVCEQPPLALICGGLAQVNQRDLYNFSVWMRRISRIEKDLEVLRNRARFAAVSGIVALASGVIISGPVLFRLPPLADKIRNFTTLVPAACLLGFQLFFSMRHATTWAEITDAVEEVEDQVKGLPLR